MSLKIFGIKVKHLGRFTSAALPAVTWLFDRFRGVDDQRTVLDVGNDVYDAISARKDFISENLALGVLIGAGLKTGQALYGKPGMRASIDSAIHRVFTGKAEDGKYPAEVLSQADNVIALLKVKVKSLNRLAVDGVPGSGKTTLSKILSRKLHLKLQTLDHMNMDKPIPFHDGTIYEHHRLLRTQDIDSFDAIIYIDEPIERSKQKLLERKRGGYLVDIMDYEKLKQVGEMAFSFAEGEVHTIPQSYLKVKIQPEHGFQVKENLLSELQKQGIRTDSFSELSKEELLFLLTENRVRKGFKAYVNASAYNRELLIGVSAGLYQLRRQLR